MSRSGAFYLSAIVCSLFRKRTVPWAVVAEFCVVEIRQTGVKVHSMVGINYIPDYDHARLGRSVAKTMANCEGTLPDTYGMTAPQLAELMNSHLMKWQTRHGLEKNI